MLDGAAEAYLLTSEIKAAGVKVILHPPMARQYGEFENASFTTKGAWKLVPDDANRIELAVANAPDETRYFELVGVNLEMLDREGRKVESQLDYTLKRQ